MNAPAKVRIVTILIIIMLILTNVQAVPSRLTVSRLEQVPELPKDYGLQKLLAGGGAMEPPNDTSRWGPGHDHIYIFISYLNISLSAKQTYIS